MLELTGSGCFLLLIYKFFSKHSDRSSDDSETTQQSTITCFVCYVMRAVSVLVREIAESSLQLIIIHIKGRSTKSNRSSYRRRRHCVAGGISDQELLYCNQCQVN